MNFNKLFIILITFVLVSAFTSCSFLLEENDFNKAKQINTIESYTNFLREYPGGEYETAANLAIDKLYRNSYNEAARVNSIEGWLQYSKYVPLNRREIDVEKKIEDIADIMYLNACLDKSIEGWKIYQMNVPREMHKINVDDKINEIIEDQNWGSVSRAWATVKSRMTKETIRKFQQLYPEYSMHKEVIDLEVQIIMSGSYGELPAMERSRGNYSDSYKSEVSVKNDTEYTLTILYSGENSYKVVIQPNGSSIINIYNGEYHIAASVNTSSVRDFAGIESLSGGDYNVTYYISSTKSSVMNSLQY